MLERLHLPEPLRRHLSDSVDIGHIAPKAYNLDSDGGPLLNYISRVIGILWRSGIWVVAHTGREMLWTTSITTSFSASSSLPTIVETKTVSGPASAQTP